MTSRNRTLWEVAVRASTKYSVCRAFASSSSKKASAEASTGCSTICSTGTSRARTSSKPMPLCAAQLCLRLGHLLKRRRPLPREWRLRSPWRVVRLALHSLSWHLHPLRAVVEGRRQLHGYRSTDVTVPCRSRRPRRLAAAPTRSPSMATAKVLLYSSPLRAT